MRHTLKILGVICLLLLAGAVYGDTGTYRILDYKVHLTPMSDGTVEIAYYQKWQVTGGHIPWITIGTANGNFQVKGYGHAVGGAGNDSQGSWSGVRLDLTEDFKPGQVFEVSCVIIQKGLFYAEDKFYKMEFTPGWYDRAVTDTLRITLKAFAKQELVITEPEPDETAGEEMSWVKYDLGEGEQFGVTITIPKESFPGGIKEENLKGGTGGGLWVITVIIFMGFIFVLIGMVTRLSRRRYTGGNIFFGGLADILSGKGGSGSSGRSSGGGGGFGGRSSSCACACVSCACACACAGGGGAGCAKKTVHICPVCAPGQKS